MLIQMPQEDLRELEARQTNRVWRLLEAHLNHRRQILLDQLLNLDSQPVDFLRGQIKMLDEVLSAPERMIRTAKEEAIKRSRT